MLPFPHVADWIRGLTVNGVATYYEDRRWDAARPATTAHGYRGWLFGRCPVAAGERMHCQADSLARGKMRRDDFIARTGW